MNTNEVLKSIRDKIENLPCPNAIGHDLWCVRSHISRSKVLALLDEEIQK